MKSCGDSIRAAQNYNVLVDAGGGRRIGEGSEDSAPDQFATGMSLGRYEIEGRLGRGGMGEVFRARDTRLGRSVAIKTSQQRFTSRFENELAPSLR